MTDSKRRVPAGRPFVKGDPRINRRGPVSKSRQSFTNEFNNALAERANAQKLVDKLVSLAEHGVEWAMKEALDRLMGKVSQPMDLKATLTFGFGENGNGHDQ